MLLTVIIPYYNADAWIGRMLDSLLNQDLEAGDYEIIVVDDESPQEPVVLKDYADRYPQVVYHRVPHGRQALARNYALSVAKGEWIYFCDSDDFVQPQVFGGILRAARERDLEMIVTHSLKVGEHDPAPAAPRRNFDSVSPTMTGLEYLANLRAPFNWGVGSYFIKRAVLQDNGLTFENVDFAEDRLFKLELLQKVSRCATVDVDLYFYVQHEASFFHAKRKQHNAAFIDSFFRFIDRVAALAGKPDTPPQLAKSLKRRLDKTAFYMLKDVFLYSPRAVNASCSARLEERGLYPIPVDRARDPRRIRTLIRLMNHRRLWLFLQRIYHLI